MAKTKTPKEPIAGVRLTIELDSFASDFAKAAAVCPSKSPKPSLEYVLLAVEEVDGAMQATLTATNMEVSVTIKTSSVETNAGLAVSMLLPAKKFQAILNTLTDDHLTLTLSEKGAIQLTSGRTRMEIPTLPVGEFPQVKAAANAKRVTVSAAQLRTAIDRTVYATDEESSRYALGSILLEAEGEILTVVAADGRRCAVQRIDFSGSDEAIRDKTIVPAFAALLVKKLLSDCEGGIEIGSTVNSFCCDSERMSFTTRLVEGSFPQWRQVFPKYDQKIQAPVGQLLAAVVQASLGMTVDCSSAFWKVGDGVLSLDMTAQDSEQIHAELPIEGDADREFCLSCIYAKQYLSKLDAESTVEISFGEAGGIVFKSPEGMAVIMPVDRSR